MFYHNTKKLVMASLMASMTCIATMIIQFPIGNGYIHLGDGLVLLSGIILGPIYGGLAAGIGSMFADILSGYAQYAIGTFIIKAFAAILAGLIYSSFIRIKVFHKSYTIPIIMAGICGGVVVTTGYFLYSAFYLSEGLAATFAIPGNIVQNILGIIVSCFLIPILIKVPFIRFIMLKKA